MIGSQGAPATRDNTDLRANLTEPLDYVRTDHNGVMLYRAEARGILTAESHLYRSMSEDEARHWLNSEDLDWMPPTDGIPWSPDPEYSLRYLKAGDKTVQLEVPAGVIVERFRACGMTPKVESDSISWGTGPKAEGGLTPSKQTFPLIRTLYGEMKDQLRGNLGDFKAGSPVAQRIGKLGVSDLRNSGTQKTVVQLMFRTMFRQQMPNARVTARLFTSA